MEATRDAGPSTMPTLSDLDRDLLHGGVAVGGCRIVEPIAQDDHGIVYVADDPMLQRHVMLREHFPLGLAARGERGEVVLVSGSDPSARSAALAAFLRGARWLTRFDHPSIARALRVWEERGTAYLMTPLYDGEPLGAALQRLGAVDEAWLRRLLVGLCDAVGVLHAAGVHHLGLSPDTVWVLPDGRPMLLDLSTAGPASHRPVSGNVDRPYAPIELFPHGAASPVGPWTDIYAIGAIAHQALLGRPPVSAAVLGPDDTHAPIAEGLSRRVGGRGVRALPSAAFLAAIDRALAVRPMNRPQDLAALRALFDLTGSAPVPQAPAGAPASAPVSTPDISLDTPPAPSAPLVASLAEISAASEPPTLRHEVPPPVPPSPAPDVVKASGPAEPALQPAPESTAPAAPEAISPPPPPPRPATAPAPKGRHEPAFGPAPAPVHAGAYDEDVDPAAAAAIAMAVSSLPWAHEPPGASRDTPPTGFGPSTFGAMPLPRRGDREPGLGTPTWTMPAPPRRKKKGSRSLAPRVAAAICGLIACVGMGGWYLMDHPELVAAWRDGGTSESARADSGAPATESVAAQSAAPAPIERVLADDPPAAGPAPAPAAAAEPVAATPAPAPPPAATPPAPTPAPAVAAAPPPEPAAPAPEPAPPKSRAAAKAPARETTVASADAELPATPRAVCGTRSNFALFRCMETQCRTARYGRHPQCIQFRAENIE